MQNERHAAWERSGSQKNECHAEWERPGVKKTSAMLHGNAFAVWMVQMGPQKKVPKKVPNRYYYSEAVNTVKPLIIWDG